MKKHSSKIVTIFFIVLTIIFIGFNAYAHSGRTDANGGHRDNKNKSGLGSYRYHCGGNPAHLHTNGVCPYSSTTKKSSASSSSSKTETSTSTNTNKAQPTTVEVEQIKINENIEELDVGNSILLTVTITPENATDKNIKWESSDENIAEVTSWGTVVAKKTGIVTITARSINGKTSSVEINVKEKKEAQNTAIITSSVNSSNNIITSNNINDQSSSNSAGTILGLGILAGGGYLGYKKYKKSN